jgi:acetoin utilization protein AcuB
MRADEMMSRDVITIEATQSIADAVEVLGEHDLRHLPVLSRGRLVGMLSDRDVRSLGLTRALDGATIAQAHERMRWTVARAMSADVATVAPETELVEVIDAMLEGGVGALPVVAASDDELLGIVSYVDVLRAVRDERA